ncbi:hypothetical protein L1965_11190 [Paracoccus sp. EGI L200073]|nr:hypothetical protein [Paracoccus salsus]
MNRTYRGLVLRRDGGTAHGVIKDLSPLQLANEIIAWLFAKGLKLKIPNAYLAIADQSNLLTTDAPKLGNSGASLVFVSEDLGVPNLYRRIEASADQKEAFGIFLEWADLGKTYAFDAWIANTDRHPRNFLYGGPDNIWLIDHGHAFNGPFGDFRKLQAEFAYQSKLADWVSPKLTPRQKVDCRKKAGAIERALAGLDIEQELSDHSVQTLMGKGDIDAIQGFLTARANHVVRLACEALGMPKLV